MKPRPKFCPRGFNISGSGERNVDGTFEVQLQEDGGGSKRQSWMETSCLCSTGTYM